MKILLLQAASFLAVIWVSSVCAYLMGDLIHIPVLASPFFMVVFMFAFAFNPLPVCYPTSRKWLLKVLVSILL